jgi:hypothetical protein
MLGQQNPSCTQDLNLYTLYPRSLRSYIRDCVLFKARLTMAYGLSSISVASLRSFDWLEEHKQRTENQFGRSPTLSANENPAGFKSGHIAHQTTRRFRYIVLKGNMESSIDTMDESKPRKRVVTEARRAQNRVAQMAYRDWILLDTCTTYKC